MRRSLFAVALMSGALFSSAAMADVAAVLRGSYADSDSGTGGIWGGGAVASARFDGNWGVQLSGDYHRIVGNNVWAAGGSVFWQDSDFRVAGSAMYHEASGANVTNFGGGIEWLGLRNVTLAARGGGFTGSGSSGGYVGGRIGWYIFDDLNLAGGVDYTSAGGTSRTSENVIAEWLVSSDIPLSLYGGYEHANGTGGTNFFFGGIKLYLSDGHPTSLVSRHRNGTIGYIGESPLFFDKF